MFIYSFQSQEVLQEAMDRGIAFVDYEKTNYYYQLQKGVDLSHAYLWMAEKLSRETGIWQQDVYGIWDGATVNENGDMIFDDGKKVPLLPFWGWYLVDGENRRPGMEYCFDGGSKR